MPKKAFYITTPLYYVNASPHIGHSYTEIACDCVSRYRRMKAEEVLFLTGTDEHGQKVERSAQAKGEDTRAFVDGVVSSFKDLWQRLDISYDDFIRTTEERHEKTVKRALTVLYEKGDIYEGTYKGFYCTPCEAFWSGLQLDGKTCPDCHRPVDEISETNYFFSLSKYQQWLKGYISGHEDLIKPDFRRNEVIGMLQEPLADLCISRPRHRLCWGIDIPFAKDYVTYVWFDALINYISACGWGYDEKKFNKFWPADFHLIGKDILRPHAVYWPIMLHALGIEPPRTIFAHGWWLTGNEKMSKSKGNVIDPLQIIERYGQNAYRYFLLREVTFGLDGVFSEEAFISRFNSDLANDLGNLLNRTLTMVEKYFNGVIPAKGSARDKDKELKDAMTALAPRIDTLMQGLDFRQSLILIWELINKANKYIESSAPWRLAKENQKEALEAVVYLLLDILAHTVFYLYPFMPDISLKIAYQLGMDISPKDILWERINTEIIAPGMRVRKGNPLFPRIE